MINVHVMQQNSKHETNDIYNFCCSEWNLETVITCIGGKGWDVCVITPQLETNTHDKDYKIVI